MMDRVGATGGGPGRHGASDRPAVIVGRKKLWRAIMGTLVTITFFAMVEGATWVHHYYKTGGLPTYKPRHLIDFHRFYRVNPEYRSRTVRVNAAGFRNDEEVTREKPANVVRIVMMGGSTVWGEDANYPFSGIIDNRETIAAHLEAILNGRAAARKVSVRVEVLNAGVVGYRLYQNLIYFNHYVASFGPDLVISMDGHNDLDALQIGVGPYRHRNERLFERAVNRPIFSDLLRQTTKYGEGRSLFVRKASSRLSGLVNRRALEGWWGRVFERQVTEAEIGEWLHEYEATIRRFDASVRITGARALFLVQPQAVGEPHKLLTPEEIRIRQHWARYRWLHTVMRERLIAGMGEVARRYGIWFEDVCDVFKDETGQVYLDYTHLTNRGARVMAERLADVIEGEVFKSAASRPDY